jgi:hypothetical protein
MTYICYHYDFLHVTFRSLQISSATLAARRPSAIKVCYWVN